jgi:acyl-CoA oxidase
MKALETMRRAAGGHGFSSYSGIPIIHTELSPTVTYEGENTILHLQTARFITKTLENINKGKPVVDIAEHLK